MKIIFTLTILFSVLQSNAQTNFKSQITEIRNEYSKINNYAALQCGDTALIEGESTEGAEMIKCYNNAKLVKATIAWYGETGSRTDEFYFKDSVLIFCYDRYEKYNHRIDASSAIKVVSTIQQRYYFNNQKLISWLSSDATQPPPAAYKQKEKELQDIVAAYIL